MALSKKLLTSLAALSVGALSSPEAEASSLALLDQAQRIAERLTPDRASAQDLVAETTIKLLQRRPGVVIDFGEDCGGYLRRSLVNSRRDQLRRDRVRPMVHESDLGEGDTLPEPWTVMDDAHNQAEAQEFRAGIAAGDRPVFSLLEQGFSERQIAAKLGQTRHFVRSCLGRITQQALDYFDR